MSTRDLQLKLDQFQDYPNKHRVHASINGDLPNRRIDNIQPRIACFENYLLMGFALQLKCPEFGGQQIPLV